jgi:hypothetical protein
LNPFVAVKTSALMKKLRGSNTLWSTRGLRQPSLPRLSLRRCCSLDLNFHKLLFSKMCWDVPDQCDSTYTYGAQYHGIDTS